VAYKSGFLGTEDFFAPEAGWNFEPPDDRTNEICATIAGGWGYNAGTAHRGPDDTWELLRATRAQGANLLLNTGPLPDGAIESQDAATLRAVGERLRAEGFPGEMERPQG
jgi:alpha-L-fucosidase